MDMSGQDTGSRRDAWAMAATATLHCLTGCAIGEVLGMIIGTALGLHNAATSRCRSCWRSASAMA